MRIDCPLCGLRDLREFTYRGAAVLLERPGPAAGAAAMDAYLHLRDNPAGPNAELWRHASGCRAWLRVVRDTRTHAILAVALARDAAGREGGAEGGSGVGSGAGSGGGVSGPGGPGQGGAGLGGAGLGGAGLGDPGRGNPSLGDTGQGGAGAGGDGMGSDGMGGGGGETGSGASGGEGGA